MDINNVVINKTQLNCTSFAHFNPFFNVRLHETKGLLDLGVTYIIRLSLKLSFTL